MDNNTLNILIDKLKPTFINDLGKNSSIVMDHSDIQDKIMDIDIRFVDPKGYYGDIDFYQDIDTTYIYTAWGDVEIDVTLDVDSLSDLEVDLSPATFVREILAPSVNATFFKFFKAPLWDHVNVDWKILNKYGQIICEYVSDGDTYNWDLVTSSPNWELED